MRPGRFLFPAFPGSRALPLILALLSLGVLVLGILAEESGTIALGAVGVAALLVGYPLSRVIMGLGGTDDPDR